MKKRYLFFLLLVPLLFLGWRGSGWRGATTIDGDYTFNDNLTVDDTLKVDYIIPDDNTRIELLSDTVKMVAYTIIGDAGNEGHLTPTNDDLFVSGALEVDGSSYLDGSAFFSSSLNLTDNIALVMGGSSDAALKWSTDQTENTIILAMGTTAKSIILTEIGNISKDHDHAAQTDPTLFIHSATDPDNPNTQWISFTHDQTDGVIDVGKGTIKLEDATTQETYVIRKHVALSGAADNSATAFFTITTTDETGSADGGMYSVTVHTTVGEATAASGAVNTASVGLLTHWTRIMASAGTGANSAIVEVNESASADEGTGAISAVTMTVAETSEFIQQVSIQVDTSGGTADAFAIVELVYSDFTTAPVIN